ncbi:MAG: PepSY domain-containing protein [Pseudomonadota bacterium]
MNRRIALFAMAAALIAQPATAQNWGRSFSDGARQSRQNGDIVPLRDVIRRLERQYGGRYVNAELFSRSGGGSEYRIDWITQDGRKVRFVVDAQSGRVIRTQGA